MQESDGKVLLLSPSLEAVSGVTTHAKMLMASSLSRVFTFVHFQVGGEGRSENALQEMLRMVLSPLQLSIALVTKRPRIVHINTSLCLRAYWRDYAYLIAARILGCRVVMQIHGGYLPQDFFRNPLLSWLLRRFLLASHRVTVLSSEELSSYRAFDAGIKLSLVPNAIQAVGLLDAAREVNCRAPLRLVYVGRMVRSKGLFDALGAVQLLKAEGVSVKFRLAGSGPDEVELRCEISRLGLEQEVQLLGPVLGEDKNRLWLDSDVLVFPTFHKEGLPYSILESLAAGCVPLTTPVGAIPDVIQDGVHGLFVPWQNACAVAAAIRRLEGDRDLLLRLSLAGRRRIEENYTVERLAERLCDIYESV